MAVNKELIYHYLLECCKHTSDPYWKSIFEDLAYGITPYSTYLHNDVLICNSKDKEFAYKICSKSSEILFNDLKTIFTVKLGIMSPSEILYNRNNLIQKQEADYDNWSSIKKKNIKETIIENFAIDMKNKFSLTQQQTKYLIDIIVLMLILKIINNDDIIIQNSCISEIRGIQFSQKQIQISHRLYDWDMVTDSDIIITDKLMSEQWNRFLTSLRKLTFKNV